MTLRDVAAGLRGLDLAAVGRQALGEQARAMAEAVRASAPAGERIGVALEGEVAVVGTAAPQARAREFGAPGRPPEAVLGRVAAGQGEAAARQVAAAVAGAIADAVRGA